MNNDKRKPKKGAGRKWAARLKELADREPPEDLVKKINEKIDEEDNKKVAHPSTKVRDLDLQ